jgi:hypothetical protein
MSFVSSLPANLPKYGTLSTWDFAKGREQYVCAIYVHDSAVGADDYVIMLSNIDFATSLETIAVLLHQLDRASTLERLRREVTERDLLETDEMSLIHRLSVDSGKGDELSYALLAPKYFDLQTGKITTTPTPQSVFIGICGISGCVTVGYVVLCYKKLGDTLDWETLRDLLIAFKHIDDRARSLMDIVNRM